MWDILVGLTLKIEIKVLWGLKWNFRRLASTSGDDVDGECHVPYKKFKGFGRN